MADKTANYKLTLIVVLLVGTAAHAAVLWLASASWTTLNTVIDEINANNSTHLSWDGSILQLDCHDSIDLPGQNQSVWLQVHSCDAANETQECAQFIHSLEYVQVQRSSKTHRWQLWPNVDETCHQFNCSTSIRNASWTTAAMMPSTKTFIFPILFIIRLIGFVSLDAVTPLLDATGLYMTKIHGGDFAQQKMWAMCSIVVIPVICGALIDLIEQYIGTIQSRGCSLPNRLYGL